MKNLVIAFLIVASPACSQEARLIMLDQPSPWPLTARLERPHSDEPTSCDARAAIERWAPEGPHFYYRYIHHRNRRRR